MFLYKMLCLRGEKHARVVALLYDLRPLSEESRRVYMSHPSFKSEGICL